MILPPDVVGAGHQGNDVGLVEVHPLLHMVVEAQRGIVALDAPPAVATVFDIVHALGIEGMAAYEIDVDTVTAEVFLQNRAVTACNGYAFGDGVAQRHETDAGILFRCLGKRSAVHFKFIDAGHVLLGTAVGNQKADIPGQEGSHIPIGNGVGIAGDRIHIHPIDAI